MTSLSLTWMAVETLGGCNNRRASGAQDRVDTSTGVGAATRRSLASTSATRFWDEPRKRTFPLVALAHLALILSAWLSGN
ncbi:MAG: hypothetical protein JNN07_06560 [Verrucomicrobiales bacterium]|nr:hypothetical protein [Verrucomicrobiales bacterium]